MSSLPKNPRYFPYLDIQCVVSRAQKHWCFLYADNQLAS